MNTRTTLFIVAIASAACGSVTSTTAKSAEPTIDTVAPDHGPTPGGATITLTGKNFSAGTALVVVGGHEATNVMVVADDKITFTLPPGDQEGSLVDVTVANDKGFGVKEKALTYNLRPVIVSVTPNLGKGSGGTMVTITGRGFQMNEAGAAMVTVAGGNATGVTVVDDQTITATLGAVAAGTKPFTPVDLVVTNANGSATLKNGMQVTTHGLLALERCCTNRVFHIDVETGTVSVIGTSQRSLHACALSTAGQVFAVTHDQSTRLASLVRWNPLTGDVTAVGLLNDGAAANHNMANLTFVGTSLYGVNTTTSNIVGTGKIASIDPATGVVTLNGASAMAVGRHNGIALKDAATVYNADVSTQSLDTIAVASSTLTTGLPLTGGLGQQIQGMVNLAGTLYLLERGSPAALYTVNLATGAMTKVASIPASTTTLCETPPSF